MKKEIQRCDEETQIPLISCERILKWMKEKELNLNKEKQEKEKTQHDDLMKILNKRAIYIHLSNSTWTQFQIIFEIKKFKRPNDISKCPYLTRFMDLLNNCMSGVSLASVKGACK